jgi:hypothetical protein
MKIRVGVGYFCVLALCICTVALFWVWSADEVKPVQKMQQPENVVAVAVEKPAVPANLPVPHKQAKAVSAPKGVLIETSLNVGFKSEKGEEKAK